MAPRASRRCKRIAAKESPRRTTSAVASTTKTNLARTLPAVATLLYDLQNYTVYGLYQAREPQIKTRRVRGGHLHIVLLRSHDVRHRHHLPLPLPLHLLPVDAAPFGLSLAMAVDALLRTRRSSGVIAVSSADVGAGLGEKNSIMAVCVRVV